MPSRRRFLAVGGAVLCAPLAGCAEPGGALKMAHVDGDEAIGREATREIDPEREPDVASLLDEARADDGAERDGERPPFTPDRPVTFRGVVYDVSWTVVDDRSERIYVVVATVGADVDPDVAYADLPAVDRDRLSDLPERIERYRETSEDDGPDRLAITAEYPDDEAVHAESALVPDPEHEAIDVDGEPVDIETRVDEKTVATYRYDLDERAPSPAAYGESLRDRQFELDSLSDGERELVDEAAADGQVVVGMNDDDFVGVGERLLEEEPIYETEETGEWLVEYDGAVYWVELDALRTTELTDRLGDR